MNADTADPRGAPAPPALTKYVRSGGVSGGMRPPFMPGRYPADPTPPAASAPPTAEAAPAVPAAPDTSVAGADAPGATVPATPMVEDQRSPDSPPVQDELAPPWDTPAADGGSWSPDSLAGDEGPAAAVLSGEPDVARPRQEEDLLVDAEADWPELPTLDVSQSAAAADAGAAGAGTLGEGFPLEAFYVSAGADRVGTGYDEAELHALAERVAARLEDLARSVREHGVGALAATESADNLSRLIAAVVAGFYAREP